MKHTPGPWIVNKTKKCLIDAPNENRIIKVGSQIVELFKEEPKAESDHGMMVAFGILMFSIGVIAAILASM